MYTICLKIIMTTQYNYYVYYSYEEFGRGYIGRRACRCAPDKDVTYFGSFSDTSFNPTQKIILQVCADTQKAAEAEVALHAFYQVDKNPHFANKAKQTSTRFTCAGNWKGKTHSNKTKEQIRNKLTGRKMSSEQIEKLKESRKGFRWWTNGKSQKQSMLCPGDGWRIGMAQGNTKGGVWYNNGATQVFIMPHKSPPLGKEWEQGKIRKPRQQKRTQLFDEVYRTFTLSSALIAEAKKAQKKNHLARLSDGVVWLVSNYPKETISNLNKFVKNDKRRSCPLPKQTYKALDLIRLEHMRSGREA